MNINNCRLITTSDWNHVIAGLELDVINMKDVDGWRPVAVDWKVIINLCMCCHCYVAAGKIIDHSNLAPKNLSIKEKISFVMLGV